MGYTSTEKVEDKLKKIKRLERFQNRHSLNTASNSVLSPTAEPKDVESPFEEVSCQQVSLKKSISFCFVYCGHEFLLHYV